MSTKQTAAEKAAEHEKDANDAIDEANAALVEAGVDPESVPDAGNPADTRVALVERIDSYVATMNRGEWQARKLLEEAADALR